MPEMEMFNGHYCLDRSFALRSHELVSFGTVPSTGSTSNGGRSLTSPSFNSTGLDLPLLFLPSDTSNG